MGPAMTGITCMNDHVFVCPRALCRSYFSLLEVFQSEHCVPVVNASQHTGLSTIFAAEGHSGRLVPNGVHGPPASPFVVPSAPQTWFTAQWYVFARFTAAGRVCRAAEAPESCCGAIREIEWWYTLANVAPPNSKITLAAESVTNTLPVPTVELDCGRIAWSHRGPKDHSQMNASAARCRTLLASQREAQQQQAWRETRFVAAFRAECTKKWSCSRADRYGIARHQVDSSEPSASEP
eukprot:5439242-Prymnesium_polylepis.1